MEQGDVCSPRLQPVLRCLDLAVKTVFGDSHVLLHNSCSSTVPSIAGAMVIDCCSSCKDPASTTTTSSHARPAVEAVPCGVVETPTDSTYLMDSSHTAALLEQLHHELATAGITYTAVAAPTSPRCAESSPACDGCVSDGCDAYKLDSSSSGTASFSRADSTDSLGSTSSISGTNSIGSSSSNCSRRSLDGAASCMIRLVDGSDACGVLPAVKLLLGGCDTAVPAGYDSTQLWRHAQQAANDGSQHCHHAQEVAIGPAGGGGYPAAVEAPLSYTAQQVLLYLEALPCCLGDLPRPSALPRLISAVNSQLCSNSAGQLLGAAAFDKLLTATLQAIAESAAGFHTGSIQQGVDGCPQGDTPSCRKSSLPGQQQQQQAEGVALQVLLQQAGVGGHEWQRAARAVLSMRELGWGWWQIVECVVAA